MAKFFDNRINTASPYLVELPMWSGPFELLLDLVKTSQLDINEISVSKITRDYLSTIRTLQAMDVELAADFLVMASILILIKTRSLLPSEETLSDDELEFHDGSAKALIRELLTYQKFKTAASVLGGNAMQDLEILVGTDHRETPLPSVENKKKENPDEVLSIADLLKAMARIAQRRANMDDQVFVLPKKITISVKEKITVIRSFLKGNKRASFFEILKTTDGRYGYLGVLFATLELYRLQEISAVQEKAFQDIVIFPKKAFE